MKTGVLTAAEPWTSRRRRAAHLVDVYPHAAEMLGLYVALVDAWLPAIERVRAHPPPAAGLPAVAAAEVLPGVLDATLAAGPAFLGESALWRCQETDVRELVERWLTGGEQSSVDRYLARAATAPLLEALPGLARELGGQAGDARHCPNCGGLPQLAWFDLPGEALVTAPRRLLCGRCAHSWVYPRMVCAGCGSMDTARLPIYSDGERLPHLRIDACDSCRGYLVTVDLPRGPDAVPVVDELAALPLDLFARERGFTKIQANLMGV